MITYDTKLQDVEIIISVTCDKCKEVISTDDLVGIQEMHHIRHQGGYGSIFGDGNEVCCDLCQHCLRDLISDFFRIKGDK